MIIDLIIPSKVFQNLSAPSYSIKYWYLSKMHPIVTNNELKYVTFRRNHPSNCTQFNFLRKVEKKT